MFEKLLFWWSLTDNPKFVSVSSSPSQSAVRLAACFVCLMSVFKIFLQPVFLFHSPLTVLSTTSSIQLKAITEGPCQHTHMHNPAPHPGLPPSQTIQHPHKSFNNTVLSYHQKATGKSEQRAVCLYVSQKRQNWFICEHILNIFVSLLSTHVTLVQ